MSSDRHAEPDAGELAADLDALRQGAGAVWVDRDAVAVAGPDAVSFLQGQLSQDLDPLAEGRSAWSFLLQPQGKVETLVRLTRTGDDEVVLDVDAGWGEAVQARLQRFKLRVKAELRRLDWRCLACPSGPASAPSRLGPVDRAWAVVPAFGGGVDLLGESPSAPDGVRLCGPAALDVLRIEAGWPKMGAELTEATIPAETGIVDQTVSFTKGCFTGQELVARIESRGGHVPRRLLGVLARQAGPAPPPGATVVAGDTAEAGVVTSSAVAPGRAGPIGLAYVKRSVEPPAAVTLRWDGAELAADVVTLPLPAP